MLRRGDDERERRSNLLLWLLVILFPLPFTSWRVGLVFFLLYCVSVVLVLWSSGRLR
jgi:hypothetical protein